MKTLLLTLFLCLAFTGINAQGKRNIVSKKTDTTSQRHVYNSVEEMPEPEGGVTKLISSISKNLIYPTSCNQPGGRIVVSFVVEADGKIDGESVVKDPCGKDHILSNQLFTIVKKVKWKPGTMHGKPVAVRYSLPMFICLGYNN